MSEIAFFPWFRIDEPVQIGDFELIVYNSEGSLNIQDDLDNIIGDFYTHEEREVTKCVLLKLKEKDLGEEFDEEERRRIFLLSELLTFSGLAARAFFYGARCGYSNKDVYQIVIRKYDNSESGYRTTQRRRDGQTNTIITKDAKKIRRPDHIQSFIKTPINFYLLDSLYNGSQCLSDAEWNPIYESIITFSLANTDSQRVREEMELVLLFSSFERLFDVGKNTNKLYELFTETIVPSNDIEPEKCERISKFDDESRYKKIETLRELWIKDFSNLRGNLAHGRYDNNYPSFWSIHEHLLYASFILPICLKIKLLEFELIELSEADKDCIELFEKLLSINSLEVTDDSNPWLDTIFSYKRRKSIEDAFGN